MGDAWNNMIDGLEEALRSVGTTLGDWIPRILVALLVLIVGRWLLRMARVWIEKLLETPAAASVFERAGITSALQPSGRKPAALVATIGFAFLALVLWLVVFRVLQIRPIEELLQRLIAVLPLVFVAVVLVIVAAAVANFVADLVRPYAVDREVPWLPGAVRVVILVAGVLASLDLLEIRFAEDIVKILAAALGVAFAIAFGVGGIETARRWWGRYLSPKS